MCLIGQMRVSAGSVHYSCRGSFRSVGATGNSFPNSFREKIDRSSRAVARPICHRFHFTPPLPKVEKTDCQRGESKKRAKCEILEGNTATPAEQAHDRGIGKGEESPVENPPEGVLLEPVSPQQQGAAHPAFHHTREDGDSCAVEDRGPQNRGNKREKSPHKSPIDDSAHCTCPETGNTCSDKTSPEESEHESRGYTARATMPALQSFPHSIDIEEIFSDLRLFKKNRHADE